MTPTEYCLDVIRRQTERDIQTIHSQAMEIKQLRAIIIEMEKQRGNLDTVKRPVGLTEGDIKPIPREMVAEDTYCRECGRPAGRVIPEQV